MRTVTRREALALRRARESLLDHDDFQPDALVGDHPGPLERCERRERLRRARRLLAALKADERRAIVLQASGYSYAEICRITGWTYTKVNRCLAEGRARLRELSLVA
jgi:DNA-directed RNA polymerase specialized sigma24 family protein